MFGSRGFQFALRAHACVLPPEDIFICLKGVGKAPVLGIFTIQRPEVVKAVIFDHGKIPPPTRGQCFWISSKLHRSFESMSIAWCS